MLVRAYGVRAAYLFGLPVVYAIRNRHVGAWPPQNRSSLVILKKKVSNNYSVVFYELIQRYGLVRHHHLVTCKTGMCLPSLHAEVKL